jgi:hypothetical protein
MIYQLKRRDKAKLLFMLTLFMVSAILVFTIPDSADARVPYVYQWKSTGSNGINELSMEFDYSIGSATTNLIEIRQKGSGSNQVTLKQGEEEDYKVSITGNTLTIQFPSIDIITDSGTATIPRVSARYPDIIEWELYIPVGALEFDKYSQLMDIVIIFNIWEAEPGFSSSFMTATADDINARVFYNNAPRSIKVYLPSDYITSLKTIHRFEGVFHDDDLTPPELSNIDIVTKTGVEQIYLKVGNSAERRLSLDPLAKCFTAGYAGLEAGLHNDDNGDNITIKAYDQYGKLLEERNFKLKVGAKESNDSKDFIVEDYIPKAGKALKNEYTLYDLVNNPATAETILAKIPAGDLDTLRIFYPNKPNQLNVKDLNEMADALARPVSSKLLTMTTSLSSCPELNIKDSLTLDGKGNGLKFASGKKLVIGDGTEDLKVTLRNLTVTGDLDVNAGPDGSVTLENVTVSGNTEVISG